MRPFPEKVAFSVPQKECNIATRAPKELKLALSKFTDSQPW
jgi:hypothetical protein